MEKRKKKKGWNDNFYLGFNPNENKYSLVECGKNKNKKKYTGCIDNSADRKETWSMLVDLK